MKEGKTRAASETAAARPPRGVFEQLAERHGLQAALTAVVAWSTTVAPAAFARSSPASARVLGVAALAAAITGPLLPAARRRLGRHVGISAFLGLSALTWILASASIQPARLEPIRAALGAITWGLFALSWSGPKDSPAKEEAPDPSLPLLQARATLPPYAVLISGLGVLVGLGCLLMAWRTRETDRAMLAHGVAIACAVSLVTASASIAVGRGRTRVRSTKRRFSTQALRSLALLVVAVALAAAAALLR